MLTKVMLNRTPWTREIEVFLRAEEEDRLYVAQMNMKQVENGAVFVEPTFGMNDRVAQEFMDQLWQCGIRPTEGTGSAGALAAVQNHLADMRRLVFNERNQDEKS